MKQINLRELYPNIYKTDTYVEVTDEVMEVIEAQSKAEDAYNRRMYRYKAHYSLECNNGIERFVTTPPLTPDEILEKQQLAEQLCTAVMALPENQAKRIFARFYLDMTVKEISEAEGVSISRVYESIQRGLKRLANNFDKNF